MQITKKLAAGFRKIMHKAASALDAILEPQPAWEPVVVRTVSRPRPQRKTP